MITVVVKKDTTKPEVCRPKYMSVHEIVREDGSVQLSVRGLLRSTPAKNRRDWERRKGTDQKNMHYTSQDRWLKFQLVRADDGTLSAEITELANPWEDEKDV